MSDEKPKRRYHLSSKVKAQRQNYRDIKQKEKELEKLEVKKAKMANTPKKRGVVKGGEDRRDLRSEVVFEPNKGPQYAFLAAPEKEVLYGGSAGGGKSYAMLMDLLRFASNGNHRALLLRRTLAELTELNRYIQGLSLLLGLKNLRRPGYSLRELLLYLVMLIKMMMFTVTKACPFHGLE